MKRIIIPFLLLLLLSCYNKSKTESGDKNSSQIQNNPFSLFDYDDEREAFFPKYEKMMNSYSNIFVSETVAWNFIQFEKATYFLKCYMDGDVKEFKKITLVELINNSIKEYILLTKENSEFEYFESTSLYIIVDKEKNKYFDIFLGVLGAHYTGGQRLILSFKDKNLLLSEYDYNFPNKENKYYFLNNMLFINTSKDIFSKESYPDEASRIDDRKFDEKYYQLQHDKAILVDIIPEKINESDVIIKKGFNALQFF